LLGNFDLVVSFGVVEHYRDTAATLGAFARFVRGTGSLVTIIPNMRGLTGDLQRVMNATVYEIHEPLGKDELLAAHEQAGLAASCRYFMTVNAGVVNLQGLDPHRASTRWKGRLMTGLTQISKLVWSIEEPLRLPATAALSPYIVCVARHGAATGASGETADQVRDRRHTSPEVGEG
jgi:hypothetical protein